MSIKFRKRVRVFPGFTLNLSKTGMSATVGIKGFSLNVGNNGMYLNTGIPGTGLYDRVRLDKNSNVAPIKTETDSGNIMPTQLNVEYEVKSYNPELLTSESLYGLKQSILDAQKIKEEMKNEYLEAESNKDMTLFFLIISHILIFGFFLKKLKESYKQKKLFANELKEDYENFKLSINFNFDKELLNVYITFRKAFELLEKAEKKWDIVSFSYIDKYQQRTIADTSITRHEISLFINTLPFINTDYSALVFQNANGGDLYLYPGFLIIKEKNNNDFAIIDYKNLKIDLSYTNFQEEEKIPTDSIQVGSTWKYTNKNGSRDKRFNNNFQIPLLRYASISFMTNDGLNEKYMFSNCETALAFYSSFDAYIKILSNMKWNVSTEYEKLETRTSQKE